MEKVVILIAGLSLIVPVADTSSSGAVTELRFLIPQDAPNLHPPARAAHTCKTRRSKLLASKTLKAWEAEPASASQPMLIEIANSGTLQNLAMAMAEVPDLAALALAAGASGSSVRSECVLWDRHTGLSRCRNSTGQPALHAMIVVTGDWAVTPISYRQGTTGEVPYAGSVEHTEWTFVSTQGEKPEPGTYPAIPRSLAEGLALVGNVRDRNQVLKINGKRRSLRKGTPEVCAAAGVEKESCYALEIVNFPPTHNQDHGYHDHVVGLDDLLIRPGSKRSWYPTPVPCPELKLCPYMVANQCFGGGHPWP